MTAEFTGYQYDAIDGFLRKILNRLSDQVGFVRDSSKKGNHRVGDWGLGAGGWQKPAPSLQSPF
jgi:hypothetical protein